MAPRCSWAGCCTTPRSPSRQGRLRSRRARRTAGRSRPARRRTATCDSRSVHRDRRNKCWRGLPVACMPMPSTTHRSCRGLPLHHLHHRTKCRDRRTHTRPCRPPVSGGPNSGREAAFGSPEGPFMSRNRITRASLGRCAARAGRTAWCRTRRRGRCSAKCTSRQRAVLREEVALEALRAAHEALRGCEADLEVEALAPRPAADLPPALGVARRRRPRASPAPRRRRAVRGSRRSSAAWATSRASPSSTMRSASRCR